MDINKTSSIYPTSWKTLIPGVAKELGVSEEYVKQNIERYGDTLHAELQKLEWLEYDFFYLGKMIIKMKQLNQGIVRRGPFCDGTNPEKLKILKEKILKSRIKE